MPWYVLLIIALVSLAIVVGTLALVGLKAWRLVKHATAVSKRVTPLVSGLSRRGDEISVAVERLSANGEQLNASLAKLQRSVARLQVATRAISDALRPYKLVSEWLTGQREWGDLNT